MIFIDRDDSELMGAVKEARRLYPKAKVVVLADEDTVRSKEFKPLRNDKNAFLGGVNDKRLTINSYTHLMEMMTAALQLAYKRPVDIVRPNLVIKKDDKFPNVYIFTPDAEPMDYELLKAVYKTEGFA